ncbi:glycosyltransferase family 2 protein [Pedobacter frigiditerrae]|uniref:Glycosyltransferase family 2 protein n=1 Tax=Pedobacter frigiditerrae TaxID=2530452 RepID=A0A4R0MU19_9SPHI|nr:glycosyltransferase family 2 protein [Pedobacter frigiditerrae]TCC90599.1 glycosyltransferase family 2 protein [Pedobacter frigiditerrae]
MSPYSTCVIVPTYNEATVIKETIMGLLNRNYIIIVVDDGSSDNTYEILYDLPIFYLSHLTNLGQGAAIKTGIEFGLNKGYEYFVTFDGDGQHNPEDIKHMLNHMIVNKYDIIFGSRFLTNSSKSVPKLRKMLLMCARYFNFAITQILLSDAHNGLRTFTKETAKLLRFRENKMAHATEILFDVKHNQLKYTEFPMQVLYTAYSINKGQTEFDGFKVLQDILLNKIFR